MLNINKKGVFRMSRKKMGRFVVADADICHGKPTFNGTRIMAAQVLEQVANGMAWEAIVEEWRGDVTKEGIAEAVRLANQAFFDHSGEYAIDQKTA
jgi:uncharacterized protein (DUF433 family)